MKYFLTALSFIFFLSGTFAQGGAVTSQEQNENSNESTISDLQLRPIRLPALQEVGGSPFLSNEYKLGTVQVNNEKIVTNVPVKFNIFSNAVMVQKEGQELKLESFEIVSYDEPGNNGTTRHISFKQGYPDIDNHTGNSVYQILAMGAKVHLLKFLSQKVEEVPTLGDYSRREIVTTEKLYIYIPGGEIKILKSGKKGLLEAFPGMTAQIEVAIKAGDLNLKNESDII
ncbi:MAG: hypothetical protein ACRDEB_07075, partial [Chitinophagaceae bacterium]